jgi:hypothetical protein
MATGFAKVYGSILDSSVWMEDAPTRITWITMLVMADANGFVEASVSGIARRANVTLDQCRTALDCFQNPDPDSKDPANEGRRVTRVDGGFFILNYEKYRERRTPTQEQTAERVRRWRHKHGVTCNGGNAAQRPVRTEAEAEADSKEEREGEVDRAPSAPPSLDAIALKTEETQTLYETAYRKRWGGHYKLSKRELDDLRTAVANRIDDLPKFHRMIDAFITTHETDFPCDRGRRYRDLHPHLDEAERKFNDRKRPTGQQVPSVEATKERLRKLKDGAGPVLKLTDVCKHDPPCEDLLACIRRAAKSKPDEAVAV